MGWGNESTLVQLKRDAAKVHRLEAERDELRAENERVGRWIDNYKREQESIIAAWMARIAAVEALPAAGASVRRKSLDETVNGVDPMSFEYGWLRAIEHVRAALAASPTPAGPERNPCTCSRVTEGAAFHLPSCPSYIDPRPEGVQRIAPRPATPTGPTEETPNAH